MSKNLQKVQDMLDGNYKTKTQVGYSTVEEVRKVGDKWTDSDGYEWEQKEGFKVKKSSLPAKGLGDNCKDCDTLILRRWDKHAFAHSGRCYYCGIEFEAKLKNWPVKWFAHVRLQQLNNMDSVEQDMIQAMDEQAKINKEKKVYDMSVANALANANISMDIKKNTQ